MKKKIISIGLWTGLFLATVIVAYAITNLFFTQSRTTGFSKKVIFQFNLDIGTSAEEVGPGDSISVNPVVTNSNITITGYAIGTEDVSTNPKDAWNECKEIGNLW